ncbi:MAG: patatin-like phospholipase family protein [Candidatus Sericytochromatia bacterium]
MAIQKIKRKNRVGFVASGGAAKAACFHMGVALALQRKGFEFRTGLASDAAPLAGNGREIEVLVGSSAGAFACALISSGHPLDDIYHSLLGHRNAHFPSLSYAQMLYPNLLDTALRFFSRLPKSLAVRGHKSLESLLQSLFCSNGFYSTEKIEAYLRRSILAGNRFDQLAPELYIVTTLLDNPGRLILGPRDLNQLREKLHFYDAETQYDTSVDISHAAAASMSLPPIFKPYQLQTEQGPQYCFDGEIRKTLSTHVARDAGCDLIIASYTHQPYKYREEIGTLADYGIPSILVQALYQLIESRIQGAHDLHLLKQRVMEETQSFFDKKGLSSQLKEEFLQHLNLKLDYNPDVDYIYIHPTEQADSLFFSDHFNLSSESMEAIAENGFRSAIRALKDYHFSFSEPFSSSQAS